MITSPPYLNVTNFEEDQWLRLWFLGGPPHPTYRRISRDDRTESAEAHWGLIGDMWRVLGQILDDRADVVIRLGGVGSSSTTIMDQLVGTSVLAGRRLRLVETEVSDIIRRQTTAFRPGARGCRFGVDCHFRFG